MRARIFTFLSILILFTACKQEVDNYDALVNDSDLVHSYMDQLTDVLVHDIFSPPQASRNYAYPSIAAYEVIRMTNSELPTFGGRLNGLEVLPLPEEGKEISFPLAALHAFSMVGKELVFSQDSILDHHNKVLASLDEEGFPKEVKAASLAYGELIAREILNWANGDNYKETRSYPKFTVDNDPNTWKPTPPAYMESIEPHWNKIRTMVLDSAQQFVPKPPSKFSLEKGSQFYIEVMEVYDAVKNADDEMTEIANFWDCNPYKMNQAGHVMFAIKKITPGGHWIGITKIASKKADLDMAKTIEAYALCSIALFDGFISCWDEKYRSKLIRPETVINEHIDEEWIPILQTPPFPEHTSGHSVVSRAAAVVLTEIFGENFAFDDDTELEYGLPVRSYKSFKEASEEAAISRLYGGIHYRPAIDFGVEQGGEIGDFIIAQLDL
jgi:hypothetical protein